MSKFWVVVKNELIRYFISPLAYVYLIAFLILNGSFAIYFGHFFVRGQADLLPMFAYQPWLYLLFISGISMRSWAEEFRSKTVVQLVTMPVSVATLVWGKFWAAWIFSALALVLTFPFWVCANWLGNPDNTVIALGYVASWVLAGCMLSISQLMSALTKNQVIALVLSVVVNLIFFLSGLEYVLAFFRLFAPLSVIDMIASFSFLTHFSTMSAGLFELRDLVFFLSLLFLFNFTTILVVSFKTAGASRLMNSYSRNYYILVFVLMLLGFGGLNLAANNWGRAWRYDFTAEKIYSLSDTTQNLMQNLEHPIIAKLYYSRILEKRNPQLRQMFDRVRLLLSELKRLSNGKFDYKIYYPEVFDAQESQALAQGVLPMPIIDLNQNALFGLTFADDMDNHQVIPFFALEREQFLEQDITEKIFALEHQHKKVGILTSLPMFATEKGNSTATQEWQIIKQIRNFFDVAQVIEPKDIDGIDVLMIVHPLNLSQEMKDKIIDYSFNGGKVLLFADAAPEASRLYALVNDDIVPSQVADLAKIWGIQFHPEAVVADLANSVLVDATQNYNTNPTFTQDLLQYVFKKKNFNPNEPSISGLKDIMMASAMVVEPLQAAQNRIEFIPLISASSQSQVIPAVAALENFPADVILQRFQADDYPKVLAAKVISMNREAPFEVVAVGDTDMLYDAFWAKQNQWLDTTYVVPLLDNANFVLNILEELSGSESLAGLRGHAQLRRPFNHIEQMRKNNEREAKVKEAKILEQINQEKEKLQDVWNKRDFEERQNFSADELAVISGIRQNLDNLSRQLGAVRKQLNANIDYIDKWVKFVNIYLVPLLILFGWVVVALWRSRLQIKAQNSAKFSLNPQVIKLAVVSFVLLGIGVASVYWQEKSSIEQYEYQPLFPNLSMEINNVDRVVIKNHNDELKFFKQGGVWQLENPADVPVYQDRVRRLLSALINARFFEKKSNDARNLAYFGLNPIEDKNSQSIYIELQNDKGHKIVSLDVGKYDMDIGRGEKAAYVKFADRFQVWLAAVDFMDIEPNWLDWTYSTLWNLRFGRMMSYNDVQEADRITMLMRVLLNVHLLQQIFEPIDDATPILTLKLHGEGNSKVLLDFYHIDDNYLVSYDIVSDGGNSYLKMFAEFVNHKTFVISDEDMEKINHVLNRRKK